MEKRVVRVLLEADLLAALDTRARSEGRSLAEVVNAACRQYVEASASKSSGVQKRGALALMGAWGDVSDEEIDAFINDVYAERANITDIPARPEK